MNQNNNIEKTNNDTKEGLKYKSTQLYKNEIQKAIDEGRIENLEPYDYIVVEKKPLFSTFGEKLEPTFKDVILDGKKTDLYYSNVGNKEYSHGNRLYLCVKE